MVKARQLSEVREVVNSERFRSWFDALGKARMAAREATLRHEEILTQVHLMEFRAELAQKNATDTLYKSGEYEDLAQATQAESTDLENKSLELVGEFERQRKECSELWAAMSSLEQEVETNRSRESELRKTREKYERETAKKNRMWEDVESMWGASLEKNLAVVESNVKSRRVRRESEVLFANAEKSAKSAQSLKSESEQSARDRERAEEGVTALMGQARESFEAIVHEDFLYWPQKDNQKMVYVCPLFSDSQAYNIELKACSIYLCGRERGVEFLEPVVEAAKNGRLDTRLDDFFMKGRPTPRGKPGTTPGSQA